MQPQEVCTRSNAISGKWPGINYFQTLKEALVAYHEDNNIWKISYYEDDKIYRWLPKYKKDTWEKYEEHLNNISDTYKKAGPDDLFWINQNLDRYEFILDNINSPKEWENYLIKSLIDVISDSEFYDIS